MHPEVVLVELEGIELGIGPSIEIEEENVLDVTFQILNLVNLGAEDAVQTLVEQSIMGEFWVEAMDLLWTDLSVGRAFSFESPPLGGTHARIVLRLPETGTGQQGEVKARFTYRLKEP